MLWMEVTLLVGVTEENAAEWGSGCDQTFALGNEFHKEEKDQYLVTHTRGFLDLTDAKPTGYDSEGEPLYSSNDVEKDDEDMA